MRVRDIFNFAGGKALLTVLYALCCGALAQLLHIPLPWMVGPLLGVAGAKLVGQSTEPTRSGRLLGQLTLGAAIGLHFTQSAVAVMHDMMGLMLVCSFMTLIVAGLSAHYIRRATGLSFTTGFFASVPGGASEMVILGEKYGAAVDFVAVSQSVRMMAVVVLLPPLFLWSGVAGQISSSAESAAFSLPGLLALAGLCAGVSLLLQWVKAPAPFMLGPLLTSAALTASSHTLSSIPSFIVNGGQLLIGVALGSRMDRAFMLGAPRLMGAAAGAIVINMVLSAGIAVAAAAAMNAPTTTLLLATAPGGIAEMSLTAKLLNSSVAIVSAFHVTRLLVILTLTSPIFAFGRYCHGRYAVSKRSQP